MLSLISVLSPILHDIFKRVLPDQDAADRAQAELQAALLANASELERAASKVIISEATGESWLQRNWRPITMLWLMGLISSYWLGFTPINLTPEAIDGLFLLVQIGLGGYVTGRSIEKVAKTIAPTFNKPTKFRR